MERSFDIAVVGYGLIGASIVKSLNDAGISCVSIDKFPIKNQPVETYSNRVSALTFASKHWLERINVWQTISPENYCDYSTMEVWDGEGTGNIHFDKNEVPTHSLGYIIENVRLQNALNESQHNHIEGQVFDIISHDDHAEVIIIDEHQLKQTVRCQLVIGCDGKHSSVRDMADIRAKQWSYNHDALVATIRFDQHHKFCARQSFTYFGPLAVLPLHGDGFDASIVWSCKPHEVESLKQLSKDQLCQKISQAMEGKIGNVTNIEDIASFPLSQSHATKYFANRIVLAGDAAHAIHPLAGQGANLGFLDAAVLCEQLINAKEQSLDYGDMRILKKYQQQRQSHNLMMMGAMEGLKRLYDNENPIISLIRNVGMKAVSLPTGLKPNVLKMALGLTGPVPNYCRPSK